MTSEPSTAQDSGRQWAAGLLLAVNVGFAIYALSQRFGYAEILLVYWAETVIIAAINVPKLLIVGLFVRPTEARNDLQQSMNRFASLALLLIVYVVAMSVACMLLFVAIFVMPTTLGWVDRAAGLAVAKNPAHSMRGLEMAIAALALSHLVSLVVNFLWRREFLGASLLALAVQPALRIVGIVAVMAVALMLTFAQPWIGKTQAFALLIILAKIAVDVRAHRAERRRFALPSSALRS